MADFSPDPLPGLGISRGIPRRSAKRTRPSPFHDGHRHLFAGGHDQRHDRPRRRPPSPWAYSVWLWRRRRLQALLIIPATLSQRLATGIRRAFAWSGPTLWPNTAGDHHRHRRRYVVDPVWPAVTGWSEVGRGAPGLRAGSGLFLPTLRRQGDADRGSLRYAGVLIRVITSNTGVFVMPAVPYLQALGLSKDELVQALGL